MFIPGVGQYDPAGQGKQDVELYAPGVEEYCPTVQALQTVVPGADHEPRGQHTPEPALLEVLVGQIEQKEAPAELKKPGGHADGVKEERGQKEPAGQS